MDLLVVQRGDVLQKIFDALKRSLPLQRRQHIGLNNGDIDTTDKKEIGHVFRRSLTGHRQNLQIRSFNRSDEIGGVTQITAVKSTEDYRHQAGINLLSKRVSHLGSCPLLLLWLLRRGRRATGDLSRTARRRRLMYRPRAR